MRRKVQNGLGAALLCSYSHGFGSGSSRGKENEKNPSVFVTAGGRTETWREQKKRQDCPKYRPSVPQFW